jgi:hypothetical protein
MAKSTVSKFAGRTDVALSSTQMIGIWLIIWADVAFLSAINSTPFPGASPACQEPPYYCFFTRTLEQSCFNRAFSFKLACLGNKNRHKHVMLTHNQS